jgi:hypothetical protein
MSISNPGNSGQWFGACFYKGSGGENASILASLKPTVPGQSAQQYLTQELTNESAFTSPRKVPGVGDVAEISDLGCSGGTCSYALATAQILDGTVAEVLVTLTQPSPGHNPIISLTQTVLKALAS